MKKGESLLTNPGTVYLFVCSSRSIDQRPFTPVQRRCLQPVRTDWIGSWRDKLLPEGIYLYSWL